MLFKGVFRFPSKVTSLTITWLVTIARRSQIICCKTSQVFRASIIFEVSIVCSLISRVSGGAQVPPIYPTAVSVSTAECQDEGIQGYPEVSPESDPTSCILCCSLTAVGGSKNGVKPELARIKSWVKKGGMVDWRVGGGLVLTANGRPWNPDNCQITTTDLNLSQIPKVTKVSDWHVVIDNS